MCPTEKQVALLQRKPFAFYGKVWRPPTCVHRQYLRTNAFAGYVLCLLDIVLYFAMHPSNFFKESNFVPRKVTSSLMDLKKESRICPTKQMRNPENT